jgi:hypothetical protein
MLVLENKELLLLGHCEQDCTAMYRKYVFQLLFKNSSVRLC